MVTAPPMGKGGPEEVELGEIILRILGGWSP